ncbi:indole-3-glycerol phosphate synthase TrpC [Gottfriedia luciferensis]|uniref:indole-3-glycerol phosphate synthase TrpC n=1 Tax=Gottfriedia luciferensis TaxID=178774 RepID=UPI000B44B106|nr:indole-3-glycerol phosphate synthase TrpC [Gottfriedia luciferensis]
METILDRIISQKQLEVENLKEIVRKSANYDTNRSFINHLKNADKISIIAEFKRASPSKGEINMNVNPAEQAKKYEENGAAAISVLTDTTFFKGSFNDLKIVRNAVDIPILCKDFIIDPVQIDIAKEHGANIVLLIAAALSFSELNNLYEYAKQQNLEVLMEIHDEDDLEKALKIGPQLYGINNRNLKTFEVNLDVTERLAPIIQSAGGFIISESGIFNQVDAKRVRNAGVHGVLVGEALMRSNDLSTNMSELMVPILKGAKR